MNKIGIVTVLYNSVSVLDDFFRTLNEQTYHDFSLYIVDNCSSDAGVARARELAKHCFFGTTIIAEPENWGVAKGNNIGIRQALADGCQYILLANNDIVLNPQTIGILYDGLKKEHADMVVPKIKIYNTDLLWFAGGAFIWFKGGTKHWGFEMHDNPEFSYSKTITYAPTCFMLIKSEVFRQIGLMDEKYFVYFDDSDFVWRAVMNHKFKLVYIPDSQLMHKVSVSTGGISSDFGIKYFSRNRWYFVRKNFPVAKKYTCMLYMWLRSYIWKRIQLPREKYISLIKAEAEGRKMTIEKF